MAGALGQLVRGPIWADEPTQPDEPPVASERRVRPSSRRRAPEASQGPLPTVVGNAPGTATRGAGEARAHIAVRIAFSLLITRRVLFRLVSDLGWKDTLAGLTVPFASSATGAFLFRQHFANLPRDLAEAAQIDGASPIRFLTRILIPLSWNVIGALAVIQFVFVWNMYLWPVLIVSHQDNQVVQVGLQGLRNVDAGLTFGPLMLAAFLISIPPILVFIAVQQPFMSGFALGADK